MTSAGPTNTYGRTPSRKRSGSQSTTRFIAQNRAKTPPTPTTIATHDDEQAVGVGRRAGSRTSQTSAIAPTERPRPASADARATSRHAASAAAVGAGRSSAMSASDPSTGRVDGRLRSLTGRHHASAARRYSGQLVLDVVEHAVERLSGRPSCTRPCPVQKLPLTRPRPASGRRRRSARCPSFERLGQHDRRVGQDLVGVAVRADVDVRRDARRRRDAAHLALHVLGDEPLRGSRRPRAGCRSCRRRSARRRTACPPGRSAGTGTSRSRRPPSRSFGKNELMKLAWRCSQHFGGFSNIGSGASPNAMSGVAAAPPST